MDARHIYYTVDINPPFDNSNESSKPQYVEPVKWVFLRSKYSE